MHLIVAIEASHEGHEEFKQWIRTKEYKLDGRIDHVFPREIRLYDLVLQEGISAEVISDLNSHRNKWESKFRRLLNSLLKLTPLCSVPDISPSGARPKKNWLKAMIIGSLPDKKNEEGFDLV